MRGNMTASSSSESGGGGFAAEVSIGASAVATFTDPLSEAVTVCAAGDEVAPTAATFGAGAGRGRLRRRQRKRGIDIDQLLRVRRHLVRCEPPRDARRLHRCGR